MMNSLIGGLHWRLRDPKEELTFTLSLKDAV